MKLLDLFCGAGGAAMGYHRAGFDEIVGVDIKPQKNYPFEFLHIDALAPTLEIVLPWDVADFDVVHASPPCQRYSLFSKNTGTAANHPDLVGPVRKRLQGWEVPYIIENVPGAPLISPVQLCGSSFGLRTVDGLGLRRHRLFESTFTLWGSQCSHGFEKDSVGVFGNGTPQWFRKKHGRNARLSEWKEAMGIDWMTRDELAEAIPPAYTEYLGKQMIEQLERAA